MTLNEFLTLSCAKGTEIISKTSDFTQIIIQGITIQEYPVENFVRPDELVLSTALVVRDHPDMMQEFIETIKKAGAAALLLAFPDDKNCLTTETMNRIANDTFPILLLPWDQPFADIIKEVTKSIWSTEEELRTQLEFLQNQLLTSYLNNQTIAQAAEILAQNLYCNVVITDANHEEKASGIYTHNLSSAATESLSIELRTSEMLYGYLELFGFDESLTLEYNQLMLEQYTITPLTLWFNKEWIVSSVQMQIKDNFICKLFYNEYGSETEILSNAKDLGFCTDCNYRAIIGQFLTRKDLKINNWTINAVDRKKLADSSSMIKEQVLLAAAKLNLHVMTTYTDQFLVIYLEGDTNDNINEFLDALAPYLQQILPDYVCAWGYDLQSNSMVSLNSITQNARTALDTVFHAKPSTLRSCFQTSNSQRMMSLIASIPEIHSLAEEILAPLIDYDQNHSSELLQTLASFCECNGRINETARMLHLHRQSLLYRLEKLEELLGMDLKQHHDFYLLDSCVQILNWK